MFRKDPVILERRYVPENTVLIKEGDYGAQAYLIQSGEVRVYTEHDDKQVELARLGTGQIVGEMSLIFDGPRTATVQATEDCNLIVITRQQFQDKLKGTDSTIKAVVHMLGSRIVDGNNTLINRKSSFVDLKNTTRIIYQNILAVLPRNRQRSFQNTVLPKLEDFIEAIDGYQDRYGDADPNKD